MNLYEISVELKKLDDALEAAGGEVSEEAGTLNLEEFAKTYEWMEKAKVDGYGKYWTTLKAQIESIRAEADRLSKRRRVLENKIDRLKGLAKDAMDVRGIKKLSGDLFTLSVQKNGGALPLIYKTAVEAIPEMYCRVTKEADVEKLRDALTAGDEDVKNFVELGEAGYSVRLK